MSGPMSADPIRYDLLVQQALRGMVRDVLTDAAKKGLPGEHHFFITFDTTADGVRLSDRLREQYPEEMTVVLQYQFRDLKVTDKAFEVMLSFGGVLERLYVPLESIKGFADPSVQFALQFEALTLPGDNAKAEPDAAEPPSPKAKPKSQENRQPARTSVPSTSLPEPAAKIGSDRTADQSKDDAKDPPGDKPGAEVVRLDRFRKK